MKDRGIYIHIPFCVRKCSYCDFTSYSPRGNDIDRYLDYLEKEIQMYDKGDSRITTIFIGGGTPSILNEVQLKRLFDIVKNNFNMEDILEYTMESNPGTLSESKLKIIKEGGINRLSIGLQAIQEKHLKFMGRIHNLAQFEESFDNARRVGFDNINVDLIFAFDGQSLDDWKETLEYVLKKKPEHISAYSLIIEEETPFYKYFEEGSLKEISDSDYLKMYRYTVGRLADDRLNQYEISNFSKEGKNCLHNIKYWECEEYFGFGISASGYISGIRYTNLKSLDEYYKSLDSNVFPIAFSEELSEEDLYNEKVMLGLRMNSGIKMELIDDIKNEAAKKNIKKTLAKFYEKGYIDLCKDESIRLTQVGREISNSIIVELML